MHPNLITKLAETVVADRLAEAERLRRAPSDDNAASRTFARRRRWKERLGCRWRPSQELPAGSHARR